MPKSRARRSGGGGGGGGRLQTVGIFLTLLGVAVLVGSLAAGLFGGRGGGDATGGDGGRAAATRAPERRIRVQVLNASGITGLAREATRVLRDQGFDVKEMGNAPAGSSPDSSIVLDRVGTLALAREVADSLGIPRVVTRPDSNLYLDVTVVLGKDWKPAPAAP